MKKMLLIAAMAAVALGASAGYNLEKVWEITDVSLLPVADCRQGFGMNGKFYINNKADQTVYVVDENGLTGETFPGGSNCACTRDEAGNIIVSTAAFPAVWSDVTTIKVIDPSTGDVVEYTVPIEDCGFAGRSDFLGFPKGNLLEDGVLYFTGKDNDGICVMTISDGEVNMDECYHAVCEGLSRDNMTVINSFTDINGYELLLYVYRSQIQNQLTAYVKVLTADEYGNYTATTHFLPEKGASNGTFPFVWNGKQLYLYPTVENLQWSAYRDGFAIAEADAETPLFQVPITAQTNPNAYQGNWLNAEVDADGVTIYQYVPGYCLRVWRLTYDLVYTVVGPDNVFGSNWDPADENNDMVMGEDGIYTWSTEGVTLFGDLEFKVVGDHSYSIYEWPMGQNNWVAHLTEGEGIYDVLITFDPNADDADRITCTLTKTGEVGPVEHTYTVAGTENLFGSNWDPTDANNDMVKGEDGIYTWSAEGVIFREDVHIEFKVVQDHSWAVNWPTQNWKVDLEAGTYDIVITFDPAADVMDKITFTATRTDVPPVGLRGDVNLDGQVAVDDATLLIDILLSGGEAPASADANLDEEIGISDVTTIIDYLLSGVWPD